MINRLGTPKDIGMAAVFLLSGASEYITAVELRVDGGVMVSF
jgi:NAD(P)-dependent dehydrogenase (short-subunit alcohol dehydrogenase family)